MTEQLSLPSVAGASTSYFQDADLATLLSRLAALQGHAVPVFRFGMVGQNAEGMDLSTLTRAQQALELWSSHFPSAGAQVLPVQALQKNHFPLLWVAHDDGRVLLLHGRLSHGACNAEDAEGKILTVSTAELGQGELLDLKLQVDALDEHSQAPHTAGDWFVFSIRRYRSAFTDAVLATFLLSLVGLVGALYSMQVYDRVVPTKGYYTLLVLSVGALVGIALELLLKQVRAYMVDRTCKMIDQELSAVFFGKALDIRMDARPRTVGTFASQIRHFESVRNFMTSSTLFILADAPFAMFFVLVIGLISWQVALVPLVMVPLSMAVGWSFRKPIERSTGVHMAESNRKNGLLIEAIDGIESVKAASGEWKLLERWRHLTALLGQHELYTKQLSTLSSNLTQTMQQLTYIGMVAVGAYCITLGELTMGGLIACTIISGRALSPLAQLPGLIVQWTHAEIALKSLDGIMKLPSDRDAGARLVVPQSFRGQLRMDKVGFTYGDGRAALDVPALTVLPGERVAVLGSVGSGKSTLIKLMSGLFKPSAGTVYMDDIDVMHLAPEFVREHVGYLPQDVRLFQGTLRDNLTLGLPSPSDSQLLRAAAMTGLDQVIQRHPKGLELEISEGGKGLSGGQRQLVGLTRLLLMQPRLMLLDEPTASMDAQLESKVMQHLFEELPVDAALVVVTHKPGLLVHVQRIVVLDQGRVIIDGPRDQVLARLRGQATAQPSPQVETAV
jgi:ATP-binding cassette subfamily C protein LapB